MSLRVLHLTTVASPIAGAELTSILLARALPAFDVDFEVCTLSPSGKVQERIDAFGGHSSSLDAKDPASWLPGLVRLEERIRLFQPQIIHAQIFHAGILGAIASKPARLPYVLTRQYVYSVEWYRGAWAKHLDRWVARQAKKVIAISTEVQTFLEREYRLPSDDIRLVHNAADVDRFQSIARVDVGGVGDDGEVRIAYVASLHPRKGHTHLLDAMRRVKAHGKRVRLLLLGDGGERSKLEEMVRAYDLSDSVSFLGWRDDVDAILATAHVYVHPALEEAFGIAIAEAMACGLPVVASNAGGIPDVVADGVSGFLLPIKDDAGLAAQLIRLIDDPQLRVKMGAAGKARAFELFSPQKLASGYADVFREVVGAR